MLGKISTAVVSLCQEYGDYIKVQSSTMASWGNQPANTGSKSVLMSI